MIKTRTEKDSMGPIEVPADVYWAAQTQRSIQNFPIGVDRFTWGRPIIRALGILKKSVALANAELGELPQATADAITRAADEVIAGDLDSQFPLVVFQTGSGTQSNMNANEVIANRAVALMGGTVGVDRTVHPNDHVNRGQSSNDTFPTAMHIAVVEQLQHRLFPAVRTLRDTLAAKASEFDTVVKTGRTHLQDATPITLGQEFRGYAGQIERGIQRVDEAVEDLAEVALGGTAVGTGVNTHPDFASKVCERLSARFGIEVRETENHFQAQSAMDAAVFASGGLKTVAVSLLKISNDIRPLGRGPRAHLPEIALPEVQPGSSIMPGKVNPVIAESAMMVAAQVIGNDATIAL